jgi:CRISPR/Cas system-associated exonuclease Cas4 (RecB family)
MKLSYSDYSTYLKCPKKYYNEKNKVKPLEEPSRYFSLYGLLIESFFSLYCNFFTKKDISLSEKQIDIILKKLWDKILNENYVNWTDFWVKQTSFEIYQSVYEDVLKNIEIFDFWKRSYSELGIEIFLNNTQDILSCRFDFIVKNDDGTVEIIDGKGVYKKKKTIDTEQLYFYILIYYLHYKKFPDKAGFLYYKFHSIDYIDFDRDIIKDFMKKLIIVKNAIKQDTTFIPIVKISKQCKWCAYKFDCDALINERKKRAEKKEPLIPYDFEGNILKFSTKGFI